MTLPWDIPPWDIPANSASEPVRFGDLPIRRFGPEEERAVIDVIRSGRLSRFYKNFRGGEKVQEFEEAFAKYHGVKHAISTSSGTAALHTALEAAGAFGNLVTTTPLTFVASASSIHMAGGAIEFIDVDSLTYNLDPHLVPTDAGFVLAVHLLGTPCDVDAIKERAPEAVIIEDCAQALGAKYKDRRVGTLGDIATFSFQETKTISTGEGGMIITNNEQLAEKCRRIRNHGEKYGEGDELGYNYRLTELQAAIGIEQLKKLEWFNWLQFKNARYIMRNLPPQFEPPFIPANVLPTYFIIGTLFNENFPLGAGTSRSQFLEWCTKAGLNMKEPGRTVGPGYDKLIYQHPYFQHSAVEKGRETKVSCLTAEALIKRFVWFDIHRWRRLEDVQEDWAKVLEYFEKKRVPRS